MAEDKKKDKEKSKINSLATKSFCCISAKCWHQYKNYYKNNFSPLLTIGFSPSFMRHADAPGGHKMPEIGFNGRQILM